MGAYYFKLLNIPLTILVEIWYKYVKGRGVFRTGDTWIIFV
jgi:hypothetical protein